jgi:hypothetical protein
VAVRLHQLKKRLLLLQKPKVPARHGRSLH